MPKSDQEKLVKATAGKNPLKKIVLPSSEDLEYWQHRLVNRKYVELARPLPFKELSVSIEHNGRSHCFPLSSADPKTAAAKAHKIHEIVVTQGWDRALATYPREITFAIFWLASPLVATYTTMFSEPGSNATLVTPSEAFVGHPSLRVLIIEPEASVRRALSHWVGRVAGYSVSAAVSSIVEASKLAGTVNVDFVLLNRLLHEASLEASIQSLRKSWPGVPAFPFGIYGGSDELFVGITGVTNGYFLQRRAPLQLLEPLGAPRPSHRWTQAKAVAAARAYFLSLLSAPPPDDDSAEPLLTHREREMLEFLSRGFQDKEIAAALGISIWTVHTHMKSTFEKLGVHNRAEAVSRYLQK